MQCRYCKSFNTETHEFEVNASRIIGKISGTVLVVSIILLIGFSKEDFSKIFEISMGISLIIWIHQKIYESLRKRYKVWCKDCGKIYKI